MELCCEMDHVKPMGGWWGIDMPEKHWMTLGLSWMIDRTSLNSAAGTLKLTSRTSRGWKSAARHLSHLSLVHHGLNPEDQR